MTRKPPYTLEEALRIALNDRARVRNQLHRTVKQLHNAMPFCDDDQALKDSAEEVRKLTAILAVANTEVLSPDWPPIQNLTALTVRRVWPSFRPKPHAQDSHARE
jgi:hypothetical protein